MFRTICLLLIATGLTGGLLAGCAAPVMEAASVTKDQVIYDENIDKARAGIPWPSTRSARRSAAT